MGEAIAAIIDENTFCRIRKAIKDKEHKSTF